MNRLVRVLFQTVTLGILLGSGTAAWTQSATKPSQKPIPKAPVAPPPEVTGPEQRKHYPILVIAHGNQPLWTLRLGMKGPERLDRPSYPPIVLEPSDVVQEESGDAWTYHAKDTATGAAVAVKLTRDPCSDGISDTKYTFRVAVEHAQIGTLNGCGLSSPDKFPEFRKKNQLDPADDTDPAGKDKDKNTALEPITKFALPVDVAYIDPTGKMVVNYGATKKTIASTGYELSLSHSGRRLIYTHDLVGTNRTIVLYDVDSGRSQDLITGLVHQAFWSPDDSRIAFLKFVDDKWQVWTLPVNQPDKAAVFSSQPMLSLHGWASPTTLLASDMENAYWLGEDGKVQSTVPLKQIYGDTYQIMSSDTIRINPINPDLLLVSAFYTSTPPGAPVDSMGLNSSFFLYEIQSKRRVSLGPTDFWARSAEWSRDGLQIYFTRMSPAKTFNTERMFWDGSGLKRYATGSSMTIGK
jgi:uncharacterized membrane protein